MKQTWEKPLLTVLVRGKPEESVLSLCKTGNYPIANHDNTQHCGNVEGGDAEGQPHFMCYTGSDS
jgi:hypothetical protein